MKKKSFFEPLGVFFILKDLFGEHHPKVREWINSLFSMAIVNKESSSIFAADEMILFGRSMDFLREEKFINCADNNFVGDVDEGSHRAIIWRRHILVWAGEHCKKLKGSFCDFGCYDGVGSKFVNDYCELEKNNISFYLYDAFVPPPKSASFRKHSEDLYGEVEKKFINNKNVKVIDGLLPESLIKTCPKSISFAHIDLNNVEAEMAVLQYIYERIVKGGIIILDDYGWINYRSQLAAEKEFLEKKGQKILELPTGQGLIIKS
tara:strand:+ start:533 stop:1321 length:789 start_codon:yes stop_codon:yes gene_type:complete